jgi:hypothetical protein
MKLYKIYGYDLMSKSNCGLSGFEYACRKGNFQVLEFFFQNVKNLEKNLKVMKNSFVIASTEGFNEILFYLIDRVAIGFNRNEFYKFCLERLLKARILHFDLITFLIEIGVTTTEWGNIRKINLVMEKISTRIDLLTKSRTPMKIYLNFKPTQTVIKNYMLGKRNPTKIPHLVTCLNELKKLKESQEKPRNFQETSQVIFLVPNTNP